MGGMVLKLESVVWVHDIGSRNHMRRQTEHALCSVVTIKNELLKPCQFDQTYT